MAYDNERIQRAILTYLQANLAASLAAVEALWTAVEDVDLPSVVTWFSGYKPTVLELPVTDFPFVAVLFPTRDIGARKSAWKYQDQLVHGFVDFIVAAKTEALVNTIAHRYTEAVVATLQAQVNFAGYTQVNFEMPAKMQNFTRHLAQLDNADAQDMDDVYFTVWESVPVDLTGG